MLGYILSIAGSMKGNTFNNNYINYSVVMSSLKT